jgi:Zn-dependent peptidase ImmA (M78 family)
MRTQRARRSFAHDVARKYLRQHRITAPPVPVEYLLVAEGVEVHLVEYEDDTAGEAWWDGGTGHVAVARKLALPRLRFTLAHEWGHLVLRHHQRRFEGQVDLSRPLRDRDIPEVAGADPLEVEANQFAAELLMPAALFASEWKRRPVAALVAQRFEVSHQAVQLRLRSLQL